MHRTFAASSCLAAVMVSGGTTPALAETDPAPVLRVILDDRSVGAGPHLARARLVASRIFEAAGVRLVWIPASGATGTEPSTIRVVVISGRRANDVVSVPSQVLGLAVKPANRIYVRHDRVAVIALSYGLAVGSFEGLVMAHELGHLLLPYSGHAPHGLMSAAMRPPRTHGLLTFSESEAAAIRATVAVMSHPDPSGTLEHRRPVEQGEDLAVVLD
jgi:hypothetical protein